MEPPDRAAPQDPMHEMYEFFAFGEALDDGFSVDAFVEEETRCAKAAIALRVNALVTQLVEMIDLNEREREQLFTEARGLAPREAELYCSQLTEHVDGLKQTVFKQQRDFNLAEKNIRLQKEQNNALVASIISLNCSLMGNRDNQMGFENKLYEIGTGICQTIANPDHNQRSGNNGSTY